MFKKFILVSSLVLFSNSETFGAYNRDVDECDDSMNQAAIGACLCISLFCVGTADYHHEIEVSHKHKPVEIPQPQWMSEANHAEKTLSVTKDKKNN